ncbi:MAG: peptidase T [Ignavibacteria bacterium GWB2_35_12]|nr:MAG: peptidase T [Ignavibacteria bacterium GWA2_35_8]OGU41426.1 MAG: peptidase T [Ignavibacteria bacterium GWB2_35_12]OGU95011.1 MAG: peptidase T [Ignavibacteria bacterium RIFOXYA2_FULL_35_10]OGV19398.1 MAG: peptidase T [Ignavibacteria bacterium RIFOXYC2_FULL_35_21]
MEKALDRLLRYVKIDTQSKEGAETTPSTEKQFNLAKLLVKELKAIGVKDVSIDEHCYVYASIPANVPKTHPAYGKVPAIGFAAHVDTSPDVTGENVKPQVIENYQGGDIILPGDENVVILESENKGLAECIGHTIVTTDGTTLLGSDDKSGIAAIMLMAETLMNNKDILHGDVKIAFTPDEEIGYGTKYFDLSKFGAKYAYTLDGELPGELNKETFSANSAIVHITGRDIHPGTAKDIMVNSIRAAADIIAKTPKDMAPETTEGYQPYIHPHILEGTVGKSTIKFLFRDFDTNGLDVQKKMLENIIKTVQPIHPKTKIELEIIEMYRNMREKLDENPLVLECLWEAAEKAGAKPYWKPIRGGTDGSRLTEMGLPTPNIFNGGQNFHSKTEWVSINALNLAVDTVINLIQIWVEKNK